MFLGVFSSFIPYFIAAGFSAVYLLVSVVQPLLTKNVHNEFQEERNNEIFAKAGSDKSVHQFAYNFEIEDEENKCEASKAGSPFSYTLFAKQDFISHHKFRPNCKFLYTENSVNILTELFFRPPPAC